VSAQPQARQYPEPTARILRCTEAEYHADPCEIPSLNQSIAHVLLTQTPLHAYAKHPRLGNQPSETTIPKIEGTVIHALLLGKGAESIDVLAFDNYRTKAAQTARDDSINAGRTPVLASKHAEIVTAADTIRRNLADQGVDFTGGMTEVPIEWQEEGNEGLVLCRGRLDFLKLEASSALILDPKKIVSADPLTCSRSAEDFGLFVQRAAYVSAVEKLRSELAGRVKFKFVFMEIEAPYAVAVRECSGVAEWFGEQRWRRAVVTWEKCLKTGHWPGYPVEPLEVRTWAANEEEKYGSQH
jgi:hypothetical protein